MPQNSATPPLTTLAVGTQIEGNFNAKGDALIAGQITGSVRVNGRLELESTARIGGDVTASAIVVRGHVEGDTLCRGITRLEAGGVLGGALTTAKLEIGQGASFDGRLKLTPDAELVDDEPGQAGSVRPLSRNALDPVPGTINAGLRRRRRRGPIATPA